MKKFIDILSGSAKTEIVSLARNQENAIDMIANNYYGFESYSSADVTNRFQVQYFALNPKLNTLQTDTKDGWWQNEDHEPNTVSEGLSPLIESKGENTKTKRYFSSFALEKESGYFGIRFPLQDDYASVFSPFKNNDISLAKYKAFVDLMEEKFNINVVNRYQTNTKIKGASLIKSAFAKIKNGCMKLMKQNDKVGGKLPRELFVAERSKANHKYANVEKVVKIYDALFVKMINKKEKALKNKTNKQISKEIKVASRLLANIFMCRITDFGDAGINKTAEKALALQFSNVINNSAFTSKQLRVITEIAVSSACDMCKTMEYSKEDIQALMIKNGFVYKEEPKDEKEALLLAKEKDYKVYAKVLKQSVEATQTQGFGIITQSPPATNPLPPAPERIAGLLTAPKRPKREALPPAPDKIAGLLTAPKRPKREALPPAPDKIAGLLEPVHIAGYLPPARKKKDYISPIVKVLNESVKKTKGALAGKPTKNAILRFIDEEILNTLASRSVRTTNDLEENKGENFGGKDKAKMRADILYCVYLFYGIKTNKAKPDSKLTSKINENQELASKAQILTNVLYHWRDEFAEKMYNLSKTEEKQQGETRKKYLNRLSTMIEKAGDDKGKDIKTYYGEYIDRFITELQGELDLNKD